MTKDRKERGVTMAPIYRKKIKVMCTSLVTNNIKGFSAKSQQ